MLALTLERGKGGLIFVTSSRASGGTAPDKDQVRDDRSEQPGETANEFQLEGTYINSQEKMNSCSDRLEAIWSFSFE